MAQRRLVLIVCILASFVAFLDGSVVNVGLPAIVRELGGGLAVQQWVVNAYLIALGSLILLAGSLSDLFGRKRILVWGLIGFAVTSVLCAVAPSAQFLIISRALQGAAGALLVPSSLALIISVFSGTSQGKAIGAWTAWTGIAFVIGPLLGGFLVDVASWRFIFAINVLPIAITLWLVRHMHIKERRQKDVPVDYYGALLVSLGLGSSVFGLIMQPEYGWESSVVCLPIIVGVLALGLFVRHEIRTKQPMLPLELFRIRNFGIGNISTIFVYGGLSLATFLITIFVQQVGGYSAFMAGMSLLPVTLLLFVLSPRFGALSATYGPRLFMASGPIIAASGILLLLMVDDRVAYWSQLFPGVLLLGFGLAVTVAPLTAAILGAIDSRRAGIGSAVNNAIARIAGLISIASIGLATGSVLNLRGFRNGVLVMAALLIAGGIISAVGIKNDSQARSQG